MGKVKVRRTDEENTYIVYLYNQPSPLRLTTKVDIVRMYNESLELEPSQTVGQIFVIPDDERDNPIFVAKLGTIQAVILGTPAPTPADLSRDPRKK